VLVHIILYYELIDDPTSLKNIIIIFKISRHFVEGTEIKMSWVSFGCDIQVPSFQRAIPLLGLLSSTTSSVMGNGYHGELGEKLRGNPQIRLIQSKIE
jgi:hypothetical protein